MRIKVHVTPKSSVNKVEKVADNEYRVKVKALPVKGEANKAVVKLMAKYLGVPKSRVDLKGSKSKVKILEI